MYYIFIYNANNFFFSLFFKFMVKVIANGVSLKITLHKLKIKKYKKFAAKLFSLQQF